VSDGLIQYTARLEVDVSQAEIMKQKLAELSQASRQAELQARADTALSGSGAADEFSKTKDKMNGMNLGRVMQGFNHGGIQGALQSLQSFGKLGPMFAGLAGKIFLVFSALQGGWKIGSWVMDSTIGKLDRLAETAKAATKEMMDSFAEQMKKTSEAEMAALDKQLESNRRKTSMRQEEEKQIERVAQAQERLNKAMGKQESPAGSDTASAFNDVQDQQKTVDQITKQLEDRRAALADVNDRMSKNVLRGNVDVRPMMQKVAGEHTVAIDELEKKLAVESDALQKAQARLQAEQQIGDINQRAAQAQNDAAREKARTEESAAKREYDLSRMTAQEKLKAIQAEADQIRKSAEAMDPVKRAEAMKQYWGLMKQVGDIGDGMKGKEVGVKPISDQFSQIGLYLGGFGGNGMDFQRRIATATEKANTYLGTIAANIGSTGSEAAVWG
jgi:hypothetical protein